MIKVQDYEPQSKRKTSEEQTLYCIFAFQTVLKTETSLGLTL